MRLRFLLVLLLPFGFIGILTNAQTKDVHRVEVEFRAGLTAPVGAYHNGTVQIGAAFGIEGRYNIKGTPWDCGLMLEITTARRGFKPMCGRNIDIWQSNRTLAISATGSYNFQQGKKVNPFGGFAIGVAGNDVVGDDVYPSKGVSLFLSPRIGVELLHHFRLMLASNISRKGYNNLQLSVGLVIGGGSKKMRQDRAHESGKD